MNKVVINNLVFNQFIDHKEINNLVDKIAQKINSDYHGKTVHILIVLKGSIFFAADLMRKLTIDHRIEVIKASSYGSGMNSSGRVKVYTDLPDIEGKDVLIVEDIVDSGNTLKYLLEILRELSPNSIETATLLLKPEMLKYDLNIKYVGKTIPPEFVVGYGLDYDEQGRSLPDIYHLDKT